MLASLDLRSHVPIGAPRTDGGPGGAFSSSAASAPAAKAATQPPTSSGNGALDVRACRSWCAALQDPVIAAPFQRLGLSLACRREGFPLFFDGSRNAPAGWPVDEGCRVEAPVAVESETAVGESESLWMRATRTRELRNSKAARPAARPALDASFDFVERAVMRAAAAEPSREEAQQRYLATEVVSCGGQSGSPPKGGPRAVMDRFSTADLFPSIPDLDVDRDYVREAALMLGNALPPTFASPRETRLLPWLERSEAAKYVPLFRNEEEEYTYAPVNDSFLKTAQQNMPFLRK